MSKTEIPFKLLASLLHSLCSLPSEGARPVEAPPSPPRKEGYRPTGLEAGTAENWGEVDDTAEVEADLIPSVQPIEPVEHSSPKLTTLVLSHCSGLQEKTPFLETIAFIEVWRTAA